MNIRKFQVLALLSATLITPTSFAEWSMNAGVTNDYLWRGLSQTLGQAAISGGADYEDDSGLFFGSWVSNVDFGTEGPDPSVEVDLYVGYSGESGGEGLFGYSFTYIQYIYPYRNLRGGNYGELLLDFNVSDFIFGMGFTTDAQINEEVVDGTRVGTFNEVGDAYLYLGYSGEYDNGWSLTTGIHFHTFTSTTAEKEIQGNPDFYYYVDLAVTKSTDYGDVTFGLTRMLNMAVSPSFGSVDPLIVRPVISWTSYF